VFGAPVKNGENLRSESAAKSALAESHGEMAAKRGSLDKSLAVIENPWADLRIGLAFGGEALLGRARRILGAKPAPPLAPRDSSAIREKLRFSEPVIASLLNVPLATARSWVQGTRSPSGAALRLLELVRRSPHLVIREVAPGLANALAV
jgi:DNA-binding transcriptional regulator YiaG